jgi:hypothetical protein
MREQKKELDKSVRINEKATNKQIKQVQIKFIITEKEKAYLNSEFSILKFLNATNLDKI